MLGAWGQGEVYKARGTRSAPMVSVGALPVAKLLPGRVRFQQFVL
jgi:hypothetical protein